MRNKRMWAAGLLLTLLVALAPAQQTVNLSGTLTGPQDTPVEGAVLRLYLITMDTAGEQFNYSVRPLSETKSDAQGKFAFAVEARASDGPAFYTCIGSKEGLSYGWKTLMEDNQSLDIRLTEAQKMIGFVQDPEGKAIAGAEVRLVFLGLKGTDSNFTVGLEPIDTFATTTCDQGRFEFNRLPEGASAEILVKKEGFGVFHTVTKDIVFNSGLTYRSGQTEIMLTMQRPCTISGVVVSKAGQQPVGDVKIMAMQEEVPMNFLGLKPVVSAADGTFKISQVPPGKYKLHVLTGSEWIASPVAVEAKGDTQAKIELEQGGLLEVKVIDDATNQPVEGATVSVLGKPSDIVSGSTTDKSGIFKQQLLPGAYQISVYKQGYRSSGNSAQAVVENQKTASVEIRIGGQSKLAGTVKRPDGKPAQGVEIQMMPSSGMPQNITTDAKGQFTMNWNPEESNWTNGEFYLVAIDKSNNLAKSEPIQSDARDLTVVLEKACVVKGRVLNEQGKPMKGAQVQLTFWGGNWGTGFGENIETNSAGEYEFAVVPSEHQFSININGSKGYGSDSSGQFHTEPDGQATTADDVILRVADQKLKGQTVDVEGKPLAEVRVYMNGDGQPNETVTSDKEGYFTFDHVCAGSVYVNANLSVANNYMYGRAQCQAGAEDVVLVLSSQGGYRQYEPPKPVTLAGKTLPDLSAYGVDVPADANSIMVFVWDMQQRPSRHFIRELAAQQDLLKSKGVRVILLNASKIEKGPLDKWLAENKIPFACGILSADPAKAAFELGAQEMPWLILTNKEKIVTAEGFPLGQLTEKINAI